MKHLVLASIGLFWGFLLIGPSSSRAQVLYPEIEVSPPDSLNVEMAAGDTLVTSFTISNLGPGNLSYRLATPDTGLPIYGGPPTNGLLIFLEPDRGQILPGGAQEIHVHLDARNVFFPWPYGRLIVIASNDPDEAFLEYPVWVKFLPTQVVEGTLNRPESLNLKGNPSIVATVELPAGFDPGTIVVQSLRLNGVPPSDDRVTIKDHDHNGLRELSVKFDRQDVLQNVVPAPNVELVLSGYSSSAAFIARKTVPSGYPLSPSDAKPAPFLGQNVPNPFNPSTRITYALPEAGRATLAIYTVSGHLVCTLVDDWMPAGAHEAPWNGTDAAGRPVASGTYFYRLRAGGLEETRRMILAK